MDSVAITVLCIISFSAVLVTPCASLQLQVQSSLGQAAISSEPQQLSAPIVLLPRKLKLFEQVKVNHEHGLAQDSSTANNKQRERNISGKEYKREENVVHGSMAGTRQEWVESSDTSEYYTMDYSHVRRRRPIHNKSLRP